VTNILVVGGGPTGLTMAAVLARYGLQPRVVDRAVVPPADRSRAIVIQARTLELFDDLGIVREVAHLQRSSNPEQLSGDVAEPQRSERLPRETGAEVIDLFRGATFSHQPVLERIGQRLGPTLELMGAALLVSTVLGTLLGIVAAVSVYSFWDYLLAALSLMGFSLPSFFVALVVLYIFAARLQVLPAFGMTNGTDAASLPDNLVHLVLPASVLALELMATLTRYARSAMLENTCSLNAVSPAW